MNCRHRIVHAVVRYAFFATSIIANAQFKVIGPPPFSPPVARQQIRTLLDKVDPGNRQKTVETLIGLLAWYRDILDEELIAAWQKDARANLPEVIESLADSRAASAIIEFSWRQQRPSAFKPAYAPMFGNLMTRFPESATPFLDDLLGPASHPTPDLSQPEAETVCRILLDMPDIGQWRKNALQILPHYGRVAESLLIQDMRGSDQEKSYRAQVWLADLKADVPTVVNDRHTSRTSVGLEQRPNRRPAVSESSGPEGPLIGVPTQSITAPRANGEQATTAPANSSPARPSLPAVPASPAPSPSAPQSYSGVRSGTLESSGSPIPQNAEYVFKDVPLVKMQLDYDAKIWEARLVPGAGQTQRLIVRNKSSGPQKRCVVHWSVVP